MFLDPTGVFCCLVDDVACDVGRITATGEREQKSAARKNWRLATTRLVILKITFLRSHKRRHKVTFYHPCSILLTPTNPFQKRGVKFRYSRELSTQKEKKNGVCGGGSVSVLFFNSFACWARADLQDLFDTIREERCAGLDLVEFTAAWQ